MSSGCIAGDRHAPADRQPLRRGKADAKAGEAARPAIDQDRAGPAAGEQLGDHRHQPLGMAAADELVALVDQGSPSTSAAEQAAVAVSTMRIICRSSFPRKSHRLDRLDLGHIMFEQALDPVLERHRRGRAARAGALVTPTGLEPVFSP
jgi:hypothetical protein